MKDDHPSLGSPDGASDGRAKTSGRPPASPTSKSAQNVTISTILAPGGAALSALKNLSKVPTICQIVCFFLGNINDWRNIALQTTARATLWARDGPESSYGSSFMHSTRNFKKNCAKEWQRLRPHVAALDIKESETRNPFVDVH